MNANKCKAHHHSCKLMGCHFVITAIDSNPGLAWKGIRAAESEILRIEQLISSWKEDSETSSINRNAGIRPVRVSTELFQLIERSIRISDLTSGAFDMSGTLARFYWKSDCSEQDYLSQSKIEKLRDLINYRLIQLDEDLDTVYLSKKGMKIGFGGIGKGYAAQMAKHVMIEEGIHSGLINASGDLMCWGNPPNRESWSIKIPDPVKIEDSILQFSIPEGSIVTSGSHYNYVLIDGVRHSHIVDPRTGIPIKDEKSVSVLSPSPEFADAMATALSVMEMSEGISLVDQINGVECLMIDQKSELNYSNGLSEKFRNEDNK